MVSIVKFAIAKLVYGLLAVFFLPLFGMSLCHFSQQLRKNEAKQKEKKTAQEFPQIGVTKYHREEVFVCWLEKCLNDMWLLLLLLHISRSIKYTTDSNAPVCEETFAATEDTTVLRLRLSQTPKRARAATSK